jgi:Tol biopolymer transport system component
MVAGVVAALAASQIVFAANNAPTTYGEIYVVAPSGAVRNVTHAPAPDLVPAVSPDGRRIAFARERASGVQIYVVGTDGRGLHAVSPRLAGGGLHNGGVSAIAWSPEGRRLAVVRTAAKTELYIGVVGGAWRRISQQAQDAPAWSADGNRLAYATTTGLVRVVSPSGRWLWDASGDGVPAWSKHGLLAVHQNSETVGIYDSSGRQRATIDGDGFAWSGDRLASLDSGLLALRPTATAAPTFRVRVYAKSLGPSGGGLVWVGRDAVRFMGRGDVWHGYDLAHRRALPGTAPPMSVFSANGVAASIAYGTSVSLVRGGKTIRKLPFCNDEESASGLQFVGRTTAVVYASGCPEPNGDIYSVAPDGTALRRLTHTGHDDFSPALSPDGVHIAYAQQEIASFCKGCPHALWVTPGAQLTTHDDTDDAPFDEDPSWSPDGATIVYANSGAAVPWNLFTVAAAGGTPLALDIHGERPAWGPKLIAFEVDGLPPKLETYDPATHTASVVATTKGRDPMALAWSRDGRLAYLASVGSTHVIAIVGGGAFTVPLRDATGLAWSPDGTRFAFVAADANGNGEVYTIGVDGKGLKQVTHNLGAVGNLSWR